MKYIAFPTTKHTHDIHPPGMMSVLFGQGSFVVVYGDSGKLRWRKICISPITLKHLFAYFLDQEVYYLLFTCIQHCLYALIYISQIYVYRKLFCGIQATSSSSAHWIAGTFSPHVKYSRPCVIRQFVLWVYSAGHSITFTSELLLKKGQHQLLD